MKKNRIIIITCVLFFMIDGAHANNPTPHTLSSAYSFGAYGSYNMRDAYRKLDGLDEYLPVDVKNPFIYGATLGRRRPSKNNPRLRSNTTMEIGYGAVRESDMPFPVMLNDGSQILANDYTRYITGGAIADWHYVFPSARQTVFVSAGIGFHLTSYTLQLRRDDNNNEVEANGYGGSNATFSPSVNVGIGLEQRHTDRRGMALVYNFRFWQSSRFIETGILFPMGVTYQEYFYSHSVSLQILFPGLERGSRFN